MFKFCFSFTKQFTVLGLEIWRREMLEQIHESLVDLVLEAIRADRQGATSVQTSVVNVVINSFVVVEDPKCKLPGDPASTMTVSKALRLTESPSPITVSQFFGLLLSFTSTHSNKSFFKIQRCITNKKRTC